MSRQNNYTGTSLNVPALQAELDRMRLLIEKIKTGGWRIPPHYDPSLKQIQELNKTLEAIAQGQ